MTDRLDELLKKQLYPEEIARQKRREETLELIARTNKSLEEAQRQRRLWAEKNAKRAKKRSKFSLLKAVGLSAIIYSLFS
ncbi:hypothetical protein LU290_07090 [Moraxella nasibovis]|uniref:hypothetical protein n=1 Tax=Moraxella nasibovis TaxID=2904120 RepID=UPI00240F9E16|nr:hypothetical protein [Moraxella nasibovis]WFF38023.1 hypothetical protein LU290_07090 [Moraxella nasibovis]